MKIQLNINWNTNNNKRTENLLSTFLVQTLQRRSHQKTFKIRNTIANERFD